MISSHDHARSDQALIERLMQIGTALSNERDVEALLERIVREARHFTNADGGSLLLVDERAHVLRWAIIQNDTLDIHIGGLSDGEVDEQIFRPVPLHTPHEGDHDALSHGNVVTFVAHHNQPVLIHDVYSPHDEFDFSGPIRFDAQTGYRTKSMLVVPLTHFEGGVIGVLQLVNARDDQDALTTFSPLYVRLTTSLASQAAVAVKNARLFEELQDQFEGFIRSIASAIDAKSAYTSGHVKRVVDVAMMLADAVHHQSRGAFADVTFSDEQRDALRIASWMHDIGKIATPEYVVDKATKLSTIHDRIQIVRQRYTMLELASQNTLLKAQLALHAQPDLSDAERAQRLADLQHTHQREVDTLRDELAFIEHCNLGAEYMSQDKLDRLTRIHHTTDLMPDGATHPRLTPDEFYNLSIRKGTLTAEEIEVIRDHARISFMMLSELPFTRHLTEVPDIAAGHHEKLNGKGYPRGLGADDLSLSARILAIADIFEALTAADRPYKKPTPLTGVKRILDAMVSDGELDAQLIDLAMSSGVFDAYAEREVDQAQRDLVFSQAHPSSKP